MLDEPPRFMGEGFVLMSSNDFELYFYMDEPGKYMYIYLLVKHKVFGVYP